MLPSPAKQADLILTLWTLEDLYENVMEINRQRKQDEKYAKLMRKLRSGEEEVFGIPFPLLSETLWGMEKSGIKNTSTGTPPE